MYDTQQKSQQGYLGYILRSSSQAKSNPTPGTFDTFSYAVRGTVFDILPETGSIQGPKSIQCC